MNKYCVEIIDKKSGKATGDPELFSDINKARKYYNKLKQELKNKTNLRINFVQVDDEGDYVSPVNESLNGQYSDAFKKAWDLIAEGMSHLIFDSEYDRLEKKMNILRQIKSEKVRMKRARDLLFDIQERLIDEQYDEYNNEVDKFLFKKNESIKESDEDYKQWKDLEDKISNKIYGAIDVTLEKDYEVPYIVVWFDIDDDLHDTYDHQLLIKELYSTLQYADDITETGDGILALYLGIDTNTSDKDINRLIDEVNQVRPIIDKYWKEYGVFRSAEMTENFLNKHRKEDWMHSQLTKGETKNLGIDEFGHVNESIKESLQNEYKQAFDLLVEGENIVGTLDTDFGKQFVKDVENLYKLKSYKLKLSVAKEMLKDIQGYLVDEQYDNYNAKIDKFMNNSKNESLKEEVLPHNINKIKELIDKINKTGYFKIDGEDISVNKGFGTVGEQIDLQSLAKQFEELGFKVRTTHFHITVYGLKDFIEGQDTKNESIKESYNESETQPDLYIVKVSAPQEVVNSYLERNNYYNYWGKYNPKDVKKVRSYLNGFLVYNEDRDRYTVEPMFFGTEDNIAVHTKQDWKNIIDTKIKHSGNYYYYLSQCNFSFVKYPGKIAVMKYYPSNYKATWNLGELKRQLKRYGIQVLEVRDTTSLRVKSYIISVPEAQADKLRQFVSINQPVADLEYIGLNQKNTNEELNNINNVLSNKNESINSDIQVGDSVLTPSNRIGTVISIENGVALLELPETQGLMARSDKFYITDLTKINELHTIWKNEMKVEPIIDTEDGPVYLQPSKDGTAIEFGSVTNNGMIVQGSVDYDFDYSLDYNIQKVADQVFNYLSESLNEDFEEGKMLKNIKDIENIYFNPDLDEDETREALEIYQSEHNLTPYDIIWVIGEDSYNTLYSDYDEDEYDDEYEDFDESLNETTKKYRDTVADDKYTRYRDLFGRRGRKRKLHVKPTGRTQEFLSGPKKEYKDIRTNELFYMEDNGTVMTDIYGEPYSQFEIVELFKEAENKEIKTYKLFRVKNGQLYPLYVDANTPVPMGVWLSAKEGPRTEGGKVKSKLGELAFRPGWHSSDYPVALHIGESGDGSHKPKYRPANQVWVECLIHDNVDWQSKADNQGNSPKSKYVKEIPVNGNYRYRTNPNMYGYWYISGEIKLLRILTDEEVKQINSETGVHDLPRKEEQVQIGESITTPSGRIGTIISINNGIAQVELHETAWEPIQVRKFYVEQLCKINETVDTVIDDTIAINVFEPGSEEYNKLQAACDELNTLLPCKVSISTTYFDYGQRWMWTTLMGTDIHGKLVYNDSWQLINPKEQYELLYGDFDKGIQDIVTYYNESKLFEKYEETKNYKRTRLQEPNTCKPNSFRTKQVNQQGDKIILCKDKDTNKWKAQAKLQKK